MLLKINTLTASILLFTTLTLAQSTEFTPGELIIKLRQSQNLTKSSVTDIDETGIPSIDNLNRQIKVTSVRGLLIKSQKTENHQLANVLRISFSASSDMDRIIELYQADAHIEYVQPNYIHRFHYEPNDSLFAQQTYLDVVLAEQAWDAQLASNEIIIGVIDTGIDYNHTDLIDALWINPGEDLNGNGRVDSTEFNGVDDDGNGFIDDIRGWDFTDAPAFPDGGDYFTPDNDPFDEHGHGTSVAGIIGATGNNNKGIAGLAFGSKIMALRAGTSLGFLEEDDIASAIIYAIENGARVLNMSFGRVRTR